ncbi:MAG TPA: DUF3099 domain-containing protein [Pseudonocardiaceae bacterium]
MKDHEDGIPVLITEAAPSHDDQQALRKRRYTIMMLSRIPFLILAGVFYQTWWLAVLCIAVSIPLPWIAVLIANDRPARKAEHPNWFHRRTTVRELERKGHPVIDA